MENMKKCIAKLLASSDNGRMCQNDSQERESTTLAAHVDFYFIVTFTLEEKYGVNFEYQC